MPYVALADLESRIPSAFLTQALDDDGDGTIDAWDAVAEAAGSAVDALIGLRYEVPRPTPEPVVVEAARVAACYLCYARRATGEEAKPWASRYSQYFGPNGLLMKVAEGKAPLAPGAAKVKPSGGAVVEASSAFDSARRRLG